MRNLKTILKNNLVNAEKIAVLGIGSDLRGDDACGMVVANELQKTCANQKGSGKFRVFFGATAPENLTGEIKRFHPSHLVIVDSVDSGNKPGAIALINSEQTSGISCSTHRLPIKIMADYLMKSIGCRIIILGIQVQKIDFGSGISKEVQKSARHVSDVIKKVLNMT